MPDYIYNFFKKIYSLSWWSKKKETRIFLSKIHMICCVQNILVSKEIAQMQIYFNFTLEISNIHNYE